LTRVRRLCSLFLADRRNVAVDQHPTARGFAMSAAPETTSTGPEMPDWRWKIPPIDERDDVLDAPSSTPRVVGSGEGTASALHWMDVWQPLARELVKVAKVTSLLHKRGITQAHLDRVHADLIGCELLGRVAEHGAEPSVAGREIAAFATELLRRMREQALETLESEDHALHALLGWASFVVDGSTDERTVVRRWVGDRMEPALASLTGGFLADDDKAMRALKRRMWRTDGRQPDAGYARQAAVGLRWIVRSLLATLNEGPVVVPPSTNELAALLLGMLPERLALKLDERIKKDQHTATTVDDVTVADYRPYLTPLQEVALPRITNALAESRSMLVVSPPGCGKTSIGQIAASAALHARPDGAKILMILPTKALVEETYEGWLSWLEDSGTDWRVVPGSQDHRRFAAQLAAGDFEVAICIYETVAQLLSDPEQRQTLLSNCALLIVDELHQLGDPERGPRLESLLVNVKRFPRDIPMLALAPVLSTETQQRIMSWLEIAPRDAVVNFERPVPLWMHVVDGSTNRLRREPTGTPEEACEVDERALDLEAVKAAWALPVQRAVEQTGHGDVIALICRLLRDDATADDGIAPMNDRRIICFVNDRDRVEEVAAALRRALNQEPTHRPIENVWNPERENPWLTGRWRSEMTPAEAEQTLQELMDAESHGPSLREVLEGLRHGVAFHSRALTRPLRRTLEREFREGMVRVIVATDTLAEGVNLPASDVVLADLVTRDGDRWRLEELNKVKQRAGRAGRLGKREEGHAFLVVNRGLRASQLIEEERDRASAVSTLDGAWRHFVVGSPEGRSIVSALDGNRDAVCDVVLRALALELDNRSRAEVLALIDDITRDTFLQAPVDPEVRDEFLRRLEEHRAIVFEELDGPLPEDEIDSAAVMDRMEELDLVVEDERHAGGYKVSELGRTLTRFALPIESTNSLEAIAAASQEGASPLSLIYLAACDASVPRTMGKWIAWGKWPTRGSLAAIVAAHREINAQLRDWAAAYAHPDRDVRADRLHRLSIPVPNRLTGKDETTMPRASLALRTPTASLDDPFTRAMLTPDPAFTDVHKELHRLQERGMVPMLRTLVAYEWGMAEPLAAIGERLDRRVRITTSRPGSKARAPKRVVTWSVPDVYQLGENLAYVLNAAATLVVQTDDAEQLRDLALRVASGLPEHLAPLLALQVEGLHREALVPLADEPELESWEQVLRSDALRVSDAVREAALAALERLRKTDQDFSLELPTAVASEQMPDGGPTYGAAFGDVLEERDAAGVARRIADLLTRHGVPTRAREVPERDVAELLVEVDPSFPVFVATGELTLSRLHALRRRGGATIAVGTLEDLLLLRSSVGLIRLATLFRRLQEAWAGVSPDEGPGPRILAYLRSNTPSFPQDADAAAEAAA